MSRLVWIGLVAVAGCVTTGTFDAKVAELNKQLDGQKQDGAAREKRLADRVKELEDQVKALDTKIAETEKSKQELEAKLTKERDDLRKQLNDATALVGEQAKRLEKMGKSVGETDQALADAKARLEELRKQKAAAEASAQTFRDLVKKLHSMIDAGQLKVVIRDGRMLIALPNDVLFDSGKTDIKKDGQTALARVAQVLATVPNRKFLVAGHTDDVPIHTSRFPSNWELSTERAVTVTQFLVQNGMKAQVLAAAGHSEFDPIAANDSPEHRAQNRRIEIVLEPSLSDLPPINVGP